MPSFELILAVAMFGSMAAVAGLIRIVAAINGSAAATRWLTSASTWLMTNSFLTSWIVCAGSICAMFTMDRHPSGPVVAFIALIPMGVGIHKMIPAPPWAPAPPIMPPPIAPSTLHPPTCCQPPPTPPNSPPEPTKPDHSHPATAMAPTDTEPVMSPRSGRSSPSAAAAKTRVDSKDKTSHMTITSENTFHGPVGTNYVALGNTTECTSGPPPAPPFAPPFSPIVPAPAPALLLPGQNDLKPHVNFAPEEPKQPAPHRLPQRHAKPELPPAEPEPPAKQPEQPIHRPAAGKAVSTTTTTTTAERFVNLSTALNSAATCEKKDGLNSKIPIEHFSNDLTATALARLSSNVIPASTTALVTLVTMGCNVCQFAWILKSLKLADDKANLLILISAAYNLAQHLRVASDDFLLRIMAADMTTSGATNSTGELGPRYFANYPLGVDNFRQEIIDFVNTYMDFVNRGTSPRVMSDTPMTFLLMGLIIGNRDFVMRMQELGGGDKFYSTTGSSNSHTFTAGKGPINITGVLIDLHCSAVMTINDYNGTRYRPPPDSGPALRCAPQTLALAARVRELANDHNKVCERALEAAAGTKYETNYNELEARKKAKAAEVDNGAKAVAEANPAAKLDADADTFCFQGRPAQAAKGREIAAAEAKAADAKEAADVAAATANSLEGEDDDAPGMAAAKKASLEAADVRSDSGVPDDAAADALVQGMNTPERAVVPLAPGVSLLKPNHVVRAASMARAFSPISPELAGKISMRGIGLNLGAAAGARPPVALRRGRSSSTAAAKL